MFSFSIGNIGALFIGIITIPIITRLIAPSEYGVANLFITIVSVLSIFSLAGLDQAFVRFFYETKKKNLLKKCYIISIMVTSILSLFLFIFDSKISSFISPDSSFSILMILYIFSLILFKFSLLILRMMQYGYRYSLIQVLQKVFDLVFIVSLAFLLSPDRYAIIIGNILTFISLSLIILLFSKSFWKIEDNDKEIRVINYKELLKYSIPLLISSLMTVLFQTLDKLFLNIWVSNEELGIYTAGFKVIAILNVIQASFAVIWAPISLEQYKYNSEDRNFYSRMSKIITVIMFITCILVVLLKDVFVLFLGSEYREAASIIPFLALMPVLYTMSETTVQGVNFVLKSHLHIIISGISLAVNVLLCLIFIPTLGMKGAAMAVGFSYVVFYLMRTFFGLKHYYFENKMLETIIMLAAIVLWIILVVFIDSNFLLYFGGLILFSILIILFKQEILECGAILKNRFRVSEVKE